MHRPVESPPHPPRLRCASASTSPRKRGEVMECAAAPARFLLAMMFMRRGGFGIERRLERRDDRTEALQHLLQHMIAPDAETLVHELDVGVAVADVPGEPHESSGALAPISTSRSVSPATTTIDPSSSTRPSPSCSVTGFGKSISSVRPRSPGQHDAPPLPVVRIEHDAVGGRAQTCRQV